MIDPPEVFVLGPYSTNRDGKPGTEMPNKDNEQEIGGSYQIAQSIFAQGDGGLLGRGVTVSPR